MDEDLESSTKAPPMQAPRSRLLLSCGESILAVAESAYRRVKASSCPVGCLARGVSHVTAPVLRPLRLRLRCLSALSLADRQLVVAQGVAAVLFPRAERVLRKVDDLVLFVDSLPVRFDGAVDGLEALVAGVQKSGVAGFAPKKRFVVEEGGSDVFRDIRCDEEAGGAAHGDVEQIREDVTAGAGSVEVVRVDDGGDGAGNGTKTIVGVASADKITGETQRNEDIVHPGTGNDRFKPSSDETGHGDDDAVQDAYGKAAHPEVEKQEAGSDKGKGEGDLVKLDMSGAERCAVGVRVKQDGSSMEVAETHATELVEAKQSTKIEKVASQKVASPEPGTSETGEASGKESNEGGDLLDLFELAWHQKLA